MIIRTSTTIFNINNIAQGNRVFSMMFLGFNRVCGITIKNNSRGRIILIYIFFVPIGNLAKCDFFIQAYTVQESYSSIKYKGCTKLSDCLSIFCERLSGLNQFRKTPYQLSSGLKLKFWLKFLKSISQCDQAVKEDSTVS